jgi:membrane protein implicated in regulation of membrane protease activity
MTILWWHWLVLGLAFLVGELVTPGGFYLIFFGLAAVIVGALAFVGVDHTAVGLLVFSALSVGGLTLFRVRLLRWLQMDPQAPSVDLLVGETATAVDTLPPGGIGKVELRGSSWSARNTSNVALPAGVRCHVIGIDGLLLFVGPEGGRP